MTTQREAFEAWADKYNHSLVKDEADGEYLFGDTHYAWMGWQAAQAQAADCGCIDQRDCTGECMKKAQTAKPGDIRALKHRIHELEGEVIGYKQILDGQATPPQHQAAMEALRKANIDCVNHFDAIKEDYDKAQAAMKLALGLLKRYRNETPIGHQPHMIAHEADAAIAALEGSLK